MKGEGISEDSRKFCQACLAAWIERGEGTSHRNEHPLQRDRNTELLLRMYFARSGTEKKEHLRCSESPVSGRYLPRRKVLRCNIISTLRQARAPATS